MFLDVPHRRGERMWVRENPDTGTFFPVKIWSPTSLPPHHRFKSIVRLVLSFRFRSDTFLDPPFVVLHFVLRLPELIPKSDVHEACFKGQVLEYTRGFCGNPLPVLTYRKQMSPSLTLRFPVTEPIPVVQYSPTVSLVEKFTSSFGNNGLN